MGSTDRLPPVTRRQKFARAVMAVCTVTALAGTSVSAWADGADTLPAQPDAVADGNASGDPNATDADATDADATSADAADADATGEEEPTSILAPGAGATRLRLFEDDRDTARGAPWLLSDEELRAQGWEYRDQNFRRGSPLAGLAALTVGLPFHGVGHLLVGDNDSMFRLLMSEIVALGVAGVGTLMRDVAPSRNGVWATGAAMQVAGLSLFGAGWIGDIVGSFKGTTVPLPRNSYELRGTAIDLHYTVLFSNEVDITSVGVLGAHVVGERFALRPVFSFGPGDGYYRGDIFAEYRQPLGPKDHSYFSVWADLGEEVFTRSGWGREVGAIGVGTSVDIGDLLEHTEGLIWQLRMGIGVQSFFYEAENNRRFSARNVRLFVPVETSVAMNLNRGLNVALGYRHRPDELVGGLARHGGMLFQRFTVLPINRLGISLQLEQGAYLRMWIGVRYYVTAPKL